MKNKNSERKIKRLKADANFSVLFKNQNFKKLSNKKLRCKLILFDCNLEAVYSLMYRAWNSIK